MLGFRFACTKSLAFRRSPVQTVRTTRVRVCSSQTPISPAEQKRKLKVRRATSAEELKSSFYCRRKQGLVPIAAGDEECVFAADPMGHFIGAINGEIVCSAGFIVYSRNRTCWSGLAFTKPEGRKHGYYSELVQVVRNDLQVLSDNYCSYGFARKEVIPIITPIFDPTSVGQWMVFSTAMKAIDVVKSVAHKGSLHHSDAIPGLTYSLSAELIDLNKLCLYEEKVVNLYRPAFLSKWITLPGRRGWTAVDRSGEVVGVAAVSPLLNEDHLYRVGPLYAESHDIAQSLLLRAAEYVLEENTNARLYLELPSPNGMAARLMKECSGLVLREMFHFPSGPEVAPIDFAKVYAMTSLNIG